VASIAPAPIKDASEQNGNGLAPSNSNLMPKRQSSSHNHRKA